MREIALSHLQQKNFHKLIELLKNNKIFDELLQDYIFKSIFSQHFINELLTIEDTLYPAFLYQCHCSNEYKFMFTENEEEEVLKLLIDKTRNYNYAKKLPNYKTSIEIIKENDESLKLKVEEDHKVAMKYRDFEIVEKYSNNKDHLLKSIFNSPQEKEFYFACKDVFDNYIILPNVAMSSMFNSTIIREKYKNYFDYYLKSTIDFVIIEPDNFTPILFFELDSKFHNDNKTKNKDEIKNKLITELGRDLIRITKRKGTESISEYIDLLKILKEEKNIT